MTLPGITFPVLSVEEESISFWLSRTSLSISSSISSGSLKPVDEKILMPLNSKGLCEAEITIPASAPYFKVRYATAGVGMTPRV